MLVKSLLGSSVETSLLNASVYQDPFAAYDWVSLAETYRMINKFPEQSQVSFLEAIPVPDALNLDESKHMKAQVSCPEQIGMHKVSEKGLTSLVYSRRNRSVRPGGTAEHNPEKYKKQDDLLDDSIVQVHNPGESTKRKNRFNNCLVYSRKKGKSSCFTGETTLKNDGLDDAAFVCGHACGETKRIGNRLDNCSFSEHVSGGTKITDDQAEYSQREEIVKAYDDFTGPNRGEIKSSHQPVNSQSKLVKSSGGFTETHIGETKRNGDISNVLLMYSRRKQRAKPVAARVNGFLVYSRKKSKVKSRGTLSDITPKENKTNGDQLSIVSSHALSVPEKYANSTSYVENGFVSSLKSSSELASNSSKTREDEGTYCNSSDATDSSISPFRQCKSCDKPGTVENMLICDECKEAYHRSCCVVRMKKVAEVNDWLCPSCLKKKPSKTKIKGRISRKRKWRVTKPFVIGIRIGKEFQADVPDWSGPTMSDTSFIGEPLEIDQSENMHDLKKPNKRKKPHSSVNWLQCREENTNGDICGKWRRAPRSEIQTKDWECFCCVFWDPSHADCAVPQELETNEILKQLKYIKMLRPRSDDKRRKLGPKGRSRSQNKQA